MNSPDSDRSTRARTQLLCAAIIVGVMLLTFWPVLGHGFVDWDDPHTIGLDAKLHPTKHAPTNYWSRPQAGLYIPVTYSVWGFLNALSGEPNSHVLHAFNLLIHICSALVVWKVLMLLLNNRDAVAALGAIVFAVHPVQVEAVAWISGMKDVLGGMLSLVAVWQYILFAQRAGNSIRGDAALCPGVRGAASHYVLGSVAFVAALLSKPSAMVVPVIVGMIDVWLLRRSMRRALPALTPWMVLSIAAMVIAKLAQPAVDVSQTSPLWARPLVALDAIAFYLRQVFFPARFCLDYGRNPSRVIGTGAVYVTWILPITVGVAVALIRKRLGSTLIVAIAIFVIGVAPVLGLVSFDFQQYSTVADHYLYLSMLGTALGIAWLFGQLHPRLIVPMGGLLVLALSVRSFTQVWTWRDTGTLFTHNLAVNPRSWVSHVQLSYHALARSDPAAAELHARKAVEFLPDNGQAHLNLGLALGLAGRIDEAIASFERAVQLMPEDAQARKCLDDALRYQESIERAATKPSGATMVP